MQKPSDELLVAYLDDELDEPQRAAVEGWLARDGAVRDQVARLSEGAALLRAAFDEVLREEVPGRLIAAARGAEQTDGEAARQAKVVPFHGSRRAAGFVAARHWWIAVPIAASFCGLIVGGGLGYFGLSSVRGPAGEDKQVAATVSATTTNWLDNVAGYHKLFVSATAGENSFADIPANGDGGDVLQKISQRTAQPGVRVPNLKPWGLIFQGARLIVIESRPAAQLVYAADNEAVGSAIGPLTVVVGSSKRPDVAPTFDRRQDTNVLYWRRKGHAYAIVGQAEPGYMWNLVNDIAYQLDAI
jgi:anti-sigma factor RsiW